MRIRSAFKDFYDSHQQLDEIEYCRSPRRIYRRDLAQYEEFCAYYPRVNIAYYMRMHIIGFCGKIYPVIQLSNVQHDREGHTITLDTPFSRIKHVASHLTNMSNVDNWIEKNGVGIHPVNKKVLYDFKKKYNTISATWSNSKGLCRMTSRERIQEFFLSVQNDQDKYLRVFEEHKTPIFVFSLENDFDKTTEEHKMRFWIDGRLDEVGLQNHVNSSAAYHGVHAWISNLRKKEQAEKDLLIRKKKEELRHPSPKEMDMMLELARHAAARKKYYSSECDYDA